MHYMAKINLGRVRGDAFKYEDFTQEQLDRLKGEPGKPGSPGRDGAPGPAVAISDSVISPDPGVAASSKAVKTAYDKAIEAVRVAADAQGAAEIVERKATQNAEDIAILRAETSKNTVLPGLCTPFSGTFGGPGGKHPVNRRTGEADLSYALCDGGTYTAPDGAEVTTPDLRDCMVMGAGPSFSAKTRGGGRTHNHAVAIGSTTLTAAQMPSHNHAQTAGGDYSACTWRLGPGAKGSEWYSYSHNTGGSQAHTHNVQSPDASNLPPYYVLAYVMQL